MLAYLDYMLIIGIIAAFVAAYGYIRLDNYEYQVIFTPRDIRHINRLEMYVVASWTTIIALTIILVGYIFYQYAGLPRYIIAH